MRCNMKKCPKCGSILYDPNEKPKPMYMAPMEDDIDWRWIVLVLGLIWLVVSAVILLCL